MAYQEQRVVETDPVVDEPVETVEPATTVETVRREPTTVVERRPRTTLVQNDDPIANVFAASQLVQTIVWSIVVLVLLVVALLALHTYAHLF
jgi:cell division protein FtsX